MTLHVARVTPLLLAAALAVPLLAPSELTPLAFLICGAVAAAVALGLAMWELRAGSPLVTRTTGVALVTATALVGWITVATLWSDAPRVSFLGMIAQHSGAALWLVAGGWFVATALVGDKRSLRAMVAIVALFGGVSGAWTVAEAVTGGARGWGSAAGPLENSSSLGAVLAVTLFAAGSWWALTRTPGERLAAAACAVACLAGIAAADSRVGMVGVAAGLVFLAGVNLIPQSVEGRGLLATGVPVLGAAVTAALVATANGALGEGALGALARFGTDRDVIWRSAYAQFTASPIAGSGPEQFSAWVLWAFDGGDLSVNATYDPHNALLGLALGGGVVAVALWLAAAISALWALMSVFHRAGRPRALAALIATPVVLATATSFTWLTPAAMILTAALIGGVLGAGRTASEFDDVTAAQARPRVAAVRLIAAALTVACVGVVVMSVPALQAGWRYTTGDLTQPVEYARLYRQWPEPAYAALALRGALAEQSEPARMRALLGDAERHASYHVDIALREILIEQQAVLSDPTAWPRFADAIERGVQADPASGLWYTLAAAQAAHLGLAEEQIAYVRAALTHRVPPDTRAYLERLASE